MQSTISEQNGITILSISGRMDATTVSTFEEACRMRIEGGDLRVIVEMKGIEYVSSAGLRGILIMQKLAKKQNCVLAFCSIQDVVRQIFAISGFESILSVFGSVDEAIAALQ